MVELASTIISLDDEGHWSILDIRGHESQLEAKAYAFDEIMRVAMDVCDGHYREVKVTFYDDDYGESVMSVESDSGDVTIVKCLTNEELRKKNET